jgi:hypothetical protein
LLALAVTVGVSKLSQIQIYLACLSLLLVPFGLGGGGTGGMHVLACSNDIMNTRNLHQNGCELTKNKVKLL